MTAQPRVLLLVPARTYRAADFILAAERMRLDLVVASDGALPLGRAVIPARSADLDASARRILARGRGSSTRWSPPTPRCSCWPRPWPPRWACRITRSTRCAPPLTRRPSGSAGPRPAYPSRRSSSHPPGDGVRQAAEAIGFPCVVKAVSLSASQGVLRADDPAAAVEAARRIRQVLDDAERSADEPLLIEEYLPGPELSIDGVLTAGDLTVTAVFDKPGMPDGPTFEETLLVTPSRLAAGTLAAAIRVAADAARALGLSAGPVHAELRICDRGPAMLELAPRSIGGLCSRALRFPGGASLEEIVLANALGRPVPAAAGLACPSGVFMLPVPRAGVLCAVEGRDSALAVPGVTGLTITIPPGQRVRPLPDGDRYLGFVFAEADTPADVEEALTAAVARLRVVIQ